MGGGLSLELSPLSQEGCLICAPQKATCEKKGPPWKAFSSPDPCIFPGAADTPAVLRPQLGKHKMSSISCRPIHQAASPPRLEDPWGHSGRRRRAAATEEECGGRQEGCGAGRGLPGGCQLRSGLPRAQHPPDRAWGQSPTSSLNVCACLPEHTPTCEPFPHACAKPT